MARLWGPVVASVFLLGACVHAQSCSAGTMPPNTTPVRVCALPWVGGPSGPPAGTAVSVIVEIGPAGLVVEAGTVAVVNGQDVTASMGAVSGGYSFTYVTGAGDTWPWAGLGFVGNLTDAADALVAAIDLAVTPGATFTDTTLGSGLQGVGNASGLCVGDVDGDGDDDLYVASALGNALWLNVGNGTFFDATSAWTADGVSDGCLLADVDNDTRLDLYTMSSTAANGLLMNMGAAFADEAVARGVAHAGNTQGSAWADMDGDGDQDLFLCTQSGMDQFYVNNGAGSFTEASGALTIGGAGDCSQAVLFDVDNDADVDAIVLQSNADALLFVNTPGQPFTEAGAARGLTSTDGAVGGVAGDFNNDGTIDVYVLAPFDRLLANDGGGVFSSGAFSISTTVGAVAIDADLDGDLDLVLGAPTGPLVALVNDNSASFRAGEWGLAADSAVVAAADVNGDGAPDIVASRLLTNPNAAAAFIVVRPLTQAGAPSAFGAVVRAVCASRCTLPAWTAVQTMSGGSGTRSQPGYGAFLGVPDAAATYDVTVVFPGGATHSKDTDPALGAVAPFSRLDVVDRPYLTAVTGVYPSNATLVEGDTVVVTLEAFGARADLVPSAACCFVDDVRTVASFVNNADGTYTLTYTLVTGSPGWPAGGLTVVAPLETPTGVAAAAVPLTLADSPTGDTSPPVIVFECGPTGGVSGMAVETVCMSCPSEAAINKSCAFSFAANASDPLAPVPAANMTSPTTAVLSFGPFGNGDVVAVGFGAVDDVGNSATATLGWVVDFEPPVTELSNLPDALTGDTFATVELQCSEVCSFDFVLDGGARTALGGNDSTSDVAATLIETLVVTRPGVVANDTQPVLVAGVSASVDPATTPAVVNVTLGTATQSFPVSPTNNTTSVISLASLAGAASLADGVYVATVVASVGSQVDVSPAFVEFTVDTTPPTAVVLSAPGDGDGGSSPTIAATADELDATFLWRSGPSTASLSAAPWTVSLTGLFSVPNVTAGTPHTVQVVAVDAAGNPGAASTDVSWTPTACMFEVPGVTVVDTGVGIGNRHFAVTAAFEWPSLSYSVDGGEAVESTFPEFILQGVPSGTHTVTVEATVPGVCQGMVRPPAAVVQWDEPPPLPLEVTVVEAPSASTPAAFAVFRLEASRRLARLQYRLDTDVGWTPCGSELGLGPLQPGAHLIAFRAVDSTGGGSGGQPSVSWTITSAADSSVLLQGLPDGCHSLTVIATDAVGNEEASPPEFEWEVDTMEPVTTVVAPPFYTPSRTVTLDAACEGEDPGCDGVPDVCVFRWESDTLGSGGFNASALVFESPSDGLHVVSVFARDALGLEDPTPEVLQWVADTVFPDTSVTEDAGALLGAPDVLAPVEFMLPAASLLLNLSSSEALSGYNVTAGDATFFETSSALNLTALPDGPFNVSVAAVDLAGNTDATPSTFFLFVDTQPPPVTNITELPTFALREPELNVTVAAEDTADGSGVAFVLVTVEGVGSVEVPGAAGRTTFTNLSSGTYNVSSVAVDYAGNVGLEAARGVVSVNLEAPTSSFVTTPPPFVAAPAINFTMVADEVATLEARATLEGASEPGPWVNATADGGVLLANLTDGVYTVELRATDDAGNVEPRPFVSTVVVVDTVAPALSYAVPLEPFVQVPTMSGCVDATDATAVAFDVASDGNVTITEVTAARVCFTVDVIEDGLYGVAVDGVDAAGNAAATLASNFTVDRVAPVTSVLSDVSLSQGCVTFANVTVCDSTTVVLALECVDVEGSEQRAPCNPQFVQSTLLSINEDCPTLGRRRLTDYEDTTSGTLTLMVDGDGTYAVTLRSVDEAGNTEANNITLQWFVDTAAPEARPAILAAPAVVVSTTAALFEFQVAGDASPGQSVFVYRLDGGAETVVPDLPVPNSNPAALQLLDLSIDVHTLEAWLRDQAGRDGPSSVHQWEIVDTAPLVEIAVAPARVSAATEPGFEFVAFFPSNATTTSVATAAIETRVTPIIDSVFGTACEDTENGTSLGVCEWSVRVATPETYTVTVRTSFAGIKGDPATYTWEYRVCTDDQYAVISENDAVVCEACPEGANCVGGLVTEGGLVALGGYWAPPGLGTRFYLCPREDACLPGFPEDPTRNVSRQASVCATGSEGILCAVCSEDYFEQFGECVLCETSQGVAWVVVFAVILAVVAGAYLFFKFRTFIPLQLGKITVTFLQVIASANTAYAVPWPPLFRNFLNTLRAFLIEAVSLTRANCAQPMSFYASLVVVLVGFKLLVVLVLLAPLMWHKYKAYKARKASPLRVPATPPTPPSPADPNATPRRSRRKLGRQLSVKAMAAAARRTAHKVIAVNWAKVLRLSFLFLFVAYAGVSLTILKTFKCVEVEGDWWLVADMRQKCFTREWFGYAVYAAIMGMLYSVGLPFTIAFVLWRNRHRLGDPAVIGKWGFLYQPYGTQAYMWEACELLRKLWLTGLLVLIQDTNPLQVTMAVIISGWAHVLHALFQPWKGAGVRGTVVYRLQHLSLGVTTFVFLMGLLFKVDGVGESSTSFDFLSVFMLLLCLAYLVVALALIVYATHSNITRKNLGLPPDKDVLSDPMESQLGFTPAPAPVRALDLASPKGVAVEGGAGAGESKESKSAPTPHSHSHPRWFEDLVRI